MPAHDSDAGLQTAALKREDLIKGYEYEKGRYIRLSREELADVVPSTAREIDICEFVQPGEVDVVLVESTFFVLPNWGSERAYGVLCKALGAAGSSESNRLRCTAVNLSLWSEPMTRA